MGYFKLFGEIQCGHCWALHAAKHESLAIYQESDYRKTTLEVSIDFSKNLAPKASVLDRTEPSSVDHYIEGIAPESEIFLDNSKEYWSQLRNGNSKIILRERYRKRTRFYPRHQTCPRFRIDCGDEIIYHRFTASRYNQSNWLCRSPVIGTAWTWDKADLRYPSENPYHCGFASPVHTIFATNRSAKKPDYRTDTI